MDKDNKVFLAILGVGVVVILIIGAILLLPENKINNSNPQTSSRPEVVEEPVVEEMPMLETLRANPEFTTLVQALEVAGLTEALDTEEPITLLAPNNDAFAKLDQATLDELLTTKVEDLKNILLYHVLVEAFGSESVDAFDGDAVETMLAGKTVTVSTSTGSTMFNTATVVEADIETTSGVIHSIDTVLMP